MNLLDSPFYCNYCDKKFTYCSRYERHLCSSKHKQLLAILSHEDTTDTCSDSEVSSCEILTYELETDSESALDQSNVEAERSVEYQPIEVSDN